MQVILKSNDNDIEIKIEAENLEAATQLLEEYTRKIKILRHNFFPVTTEMHCGAAGYSYLLDELSEEEKKQPAHWEDVYHKYFKVVEVRDT